MTRTIDGRDLATIERLQGELAEARAECERLRADNEQAWESRAHWCVEAGKAMMERDEVVAENARLRAALVDCQAEVARLQGKEKEC